MVDEMRYVKPRVETIDEEGELAVRSTYRISRRKERKTTKYRGTEDKGELALRKNSSLIKRWRSWRDTVGHLLYYTTQVHTVFVTDKNR